MARLKRFIIRRALTSACDRPAHRSNSTVAPTASDRGSRCWNADSLGAGKRPEDKEEQPHIRQGP